MPEEPALSESIDDPDGCGDVVAREDYNDLRTFAIAQVAALAALKVEKDGHKANYLYELDLRVRAEAERNAAHSVIRTMIDKGAHYLPKQQAVIDAALAAEGEKRD